MSPPKPEPGLAARRCALALLDAVLRRKRRLDEALAADAGLARLDARDRAFARNLTATTLRRLGQIDALLAALVQHMPRGPVRDVLRLGVCQLVFLKTPPHAAVDATVALAKDRIATRSDGFVNAVLRRVAREGDAAIATQDAPRLNTPDWLWRAWTEAYGAETCRAIATAHLAEPPLDISVKHDPAGWAARLGGIVLPGGTVRRPHGGPITELPGFAEGAWGGQDAGAALPARLLAGASTVIDLCAAPGGKTAQLAAAGARVIAVERSERRLALVADTLKRLGLSAELVAADALTWRPREPAEAVLLDAPCTATGTIPRHPDAPWLKAPTDFAAQARGQTELLDAAAEMVAPGGVLVYAVCSLEPEEGPAQIESFLARHPKFARRPIEGEFATDAGDLRTLPCHWPEHGGLDGFYAARLRMISM